MYQILSVTHILFSSFAARFWKHALPWVSLAPMVSVRFSSSRSKHCFCISWDPWFVCETSETLVVLDSWAASCCWYIIFNFQTGQWHRQQSRGKHKHIFTKTKNDGGGGGLFFLEVYFAVMAPWSCNGNPHLDLGHKGSEKSRGGKARGRFQFHSKRSPGCWGALGSFVWLWCFDVLCFKRVQEFETNWRDNAPALVQQAGMKISAIV